METLDRDQVLKDFHDAVNMTASEIERWLKTPESREVGWKGEDGGDAESVGHASGRKIASILRNGHAKLSPADYDHMRKVTGYVHRHLAQRPKEVEHSHWRYSLMNWGHDPLKN
ncbi:DUF3140 domain-containing protein [Sphingomonas piscis]|nr:DUF3140 domain-containing protein [Sphingomonas piscis]